MTMLYYRREGSGPMKVEFARIGFSKMVVKPGRAFLWRIFARPVQDEDGVLGAVPGASGAVCRVERRKKE